MRNILEKYSPVLRQLLVIVSTLVVLLLLGGCQQKDPDVSASIPPTLSVPTAGDTFLSSGFKIRSEIKPKASVSSDPLIFEVYVDQEGDGAGLVGYRDNVYDVYLVARQVYVVVSDSVVAHISDLSAHMYPEELNVAGVEDLKPLGFAVLDDTVVSYSGGNSTIDMVSKYEKSVSKFDPVSISQFNNMTSAELLKHFFDNSGSYVEPAPSGTVSPERQSFYVNSAFGVTIHDQVYSLGDFCEPYTYFEGMIPQGMNTGEGYREDEKVIFIYVSYLSSDGSSTFMTTDGYVQAISTTSDFTFLDVIERGMSKDELEPLLGIGLKKDELESFTPIREGLTVEKSRVGYKLTYADMTIELEMDQKEKVLASITITNYLDFRS